MCPDAGLFLLLANRTAGRRRMHSISLLRHTCPPSPLGMAKQDSEVPGSFHFLLSQQAPWHAVGKSTESLYNIWSLQNSPSIFHFKSDNPVRLIIFISVQSFSRVWLFVTPWTAPHQASLSNTNFRSLAKLVYIESVMPSNHRILCLPLLSCLRSFPASGSFQWVSS